MKKINIEISDLAYKRMGSFCIRHDIPRRWLYAYLLEQAGKTMDPKAKALSVWLAGGGPKR